MKNSTPQIALIKFLLINNCYCLSIFVGFFDYEK